MGKKNKRSSTDDDSKIKKHKKSSTATKVETSHASSSKSFKSDKRVLKPCSEKKHKEKSEEIKELSKSIKELTEAMKKQQEILNGVVSFMEKETPYIAEEPTPPCAFDCKEADGNNCWTILVKGFENLRPFYEIKKMLTRYFSSCGEVDRVFVPFECETRVPLGFAFINMRSVRGRDKALKLDGKLLLGKELKVKDAKKCEEYSCYTGFRGCERCLKKRLAHIRQLPSHNGISSMREQDANGNWVRPKVALF